jgi:hypothetical protein
VILPISAVLFEMRTAVRNPNETLRTCGDEDKGGCQSHCHGRPIIVE